MGDWHPPAWLVPGIFGCVLVGLVITIILTA
jgi:hypothetical protein